MPLTHYMAVNLWVMITTNSGSIKEQVYVQQREVRLSMRERGRKYTILPKTSLEQSIVMGDCMVYQK